MRRARLHPCCTAMIEAGGMDVGDYVQETSRSFSFRTSAAVGEADTRIVPMPGLPEHSGGYTSNDEIMVRVALADGISFLSGAPEASASIVVRDGILPDSMMTSLVGRAACDVFGHPMFDVQGLTVATAEPGGQTAPGATRLRLSRVRWNSVPIRPEPMPGMTRPPRD